MAKPCQLRRRLLHALAAGMVVAACPSHRSLASSPAAHSLAPDFTRPSIPDHTPVHLRAYRGKVVLLNFWASWCGPCLTEMPRFIAWQNRYRAQGLQILGVSMDDSVTTSLGSMRRLKVNYPILMSDPQLSLLYGGILGLPVSFLIDRRGFLSQRFEGDASSSRMEQQILQLLGQRYEPQGA